MCTPSFLCIPYVSLQYLSYISIQNGSQDGEGYSKIHAVYVQRQTVIQRDTAQETILPPKIKSAFKTCILKAGYMSPRQRKGIQWDTRNGKKNRANFFSCIPLYTACIPRKKQNIRIQRDTEGYKQNVFTVYRPKSYGKKYLCHL